MTPLKQNQTADHQFVHHIQRILRTFLKLYIKQHNEVHLSYICYTYGVAIGFTTIIIIITPQIWLII